MRFRSMRASVNTVTNIYTIPLYLPPNISNSVAVWNKKFLTMQKKKLPKNCRPQTLLPGCAWAGVSKFGNC
jgi:hypothetical protein